MIVIYAWFMINNRLVHIMSQKKGSYLDAMHDGDHDHCWLEMGMATRESREASMLSYASENFSCYNWYR